jgi:hypothetical protein
LWVPPYSEYQQFLIDTIHRLQSEGLGYRKIAQWFRDHGYETPRGKRFYGNHVYSMTKKHRLREERINQKPKLEYGPLSIFYVDHTPTFLKGS